MTATRRQSEEKIAGSQRGLWSDGWLFSLFLVAATVAAYGPLWHAGFIWDDDRFLTSNSLIKAADGLRRFWFSTGTPDYFPLTSTTLWLEWRLWGEHALGYHLVNVFLHAGSAVLWWRVLTRLKLPGAGLAAAIFALHPVNVESVAWITERKNTLAMCFFVCTLLWYVRFEDSGKFRWYWLAAAAFALALLSKTAVAPLPLVLLGLAWWRRGRIGRQDLWRSVPFFALAALLGLVTVWFQYHRAIGPQLVRPESFWPRLAAAGWAVWFYLYKAVVPLNLSFIYPRWRIEAAAPLVFLPGMLAAAGLALCWHYRRRWGRGWLFGLGYFVVMLLPVLGFFNIYFMRYSLVADHWAYFSIIGPIAILAVLLTRLGARGGGNTLRFEAALSGVLLLALGALTWHQNEMYHDTETLWRTTLARNPRAVLAYNNLGLIVLKRGQMEEALWCFQKAVEIDPGFEEAYCSLGNALLQSGQVDQAMTWFHKALEIRPGFEEAHCNLGNALRRKGRLDEAIAQFHQALEIRPSFAEACVGLGNALLQKGEAAEARAQFQKAVELRPDFAEAHNNLALVLLQQGQVDEAVAHSRKALELEPGFVAARGNLGNALLQAGRVDEAIAEFQKGLELQPNNVYLLNNLAWIRAANREERFRNGAEAVRLAERACQLTGNREPMLVRTLAAAYAEAGRFEEAVGAAGQARELALAAGQEELVQKSQELIELCKARHPYREP